MVPVLLMRTADSNNFIRDEADNALVAMVAGVSPQRAFNCLASFGAGSVNFDAII